MRPPDSRPQIDAIMMIAPPPRCFMCGTASRDARIAGNSVSSNAACHSASDVSSRSVPAARPTLLTRMSRPPNLSTVRSMTSAMPVGRRDIRLDRHDHVRPSRHGLDFNGGGRELLRTARADADAAAFGDQRPGTRQAEPAAGSGDDGNFVGELQIHYLRRRRRSDR